MKTELLRNHLHETIEGMDGELLEALAVLLQRLPTKTSSKRKNILGAFKGKLVYIADDFNAPLTDFNEYMS